ATRLVAELIIGAVIPSFALEGADVRLAGDQLATRGVATDAGTVGSIVALEGTDLADAIESSALGRRIAALEPVRLASVVRITIARRASAASSQQQHRAR